MKRVMRILLLLVAAGLVGWGLTGERHDVWSFTTGEAAPLDGLRFVEGATYDAFARMADGRVYDVYSLSPGTAQEKDCKT